MNQPGRGIGVMGGTLAQGDAGALEPSDPSAGATSPDGAVAAASGAAGAVVTEGGPSFGGEASWPQLNSEANKNRPATRPVLASPLAQRVTDRIVPSSGN